MKKVLVIDDDIAILEAIQLVLEDDGYEVMVNTDGNKTISLAQKFKPSVILLDLLLSGKDGADILILLKKHPQTGSIPAIVLSAHPSAEAIAKINGATDFLPKPFDVETLLAKVERYCKKGE